MISCASCNFESPVGMNFCGQCGASLQVACPGCQTENPPGFKFCGSCGIDLKSSSNTPANGSTPVVPIQKEKRKEAERRHLTVMFCDLVGSTELSNKVDPEELREVIREYQDISSKVVNRYDGHIAQYLGDGILVYFGYPIAHENDAHRAVSSGLGIIEAIKSLSKRLSAEKDINISVRLGIHTGHVVIGDMGGTGKTEQLALGATPNIAARLEGMAESNSLVISAATHKLIRKYFDCEDGGKHELKGIEEPIKIYKVHNENTAKIRLDREQQGVERLPLIGRGEEATKVMDRWREAKEAKSNIVLLSGEAGVGKSHLLQSIMTELAEDSSAWLNVHYCSPYHKNTAFYPIIDIFKNNVLQFFSGELERERIAKIEGFLVQFGFDLKEYVSLFAQLLSVSIEETDYQPSPFNPQQQKQKIISACLAVYLERARTHTLLLVFEDLHYADSATLELINLVINQEPNLNMLTVLTFRPEYTPAWGMKAHITPMALSKLSQEDVSAIITELTGNKRLPQEVITEIIKKTDGVPLFVEELTKMVLESGLVVEKEDHFELTGPITSLAIPSTLHDSLVARLDRMSAVKELAQLGATIGREFNFELIKAVSSMDDIELEDGLGKLVKSELLYQRGVPPMATYQFRHALIQDAASQSLLKTQRQNFHERIANCLTTQFSELVERKPEMVASHYQSAGINEDAIVYWTKAGKRASEHFALDEALSYLMKGKDLLESLEDGRKKTDLELDQLVVLSPIYTMTEGFTSQNGFEINERIQELAEQKKDYESLFLGLRGLATYHLFAGMPTAALSWAQQGLELAEKNLDTESLVEANRLIGQVCIYIGEFDRSLKSFDKAISLHDPVEHQSIVRTTGADPGIFSVAQSSHVLWYLGYPDQALERAKQALSDANRIEAPYSESLSSFLTTFVHVLRGDAINAKKEATSCITLCDKYGMYMFSSEAKNFLGWALADLGDADKGIELIKQALNWRKERKIVNGANIHITLLIGIYLKLNKFNEGLKMVEVALETAENSGDQLCLSEIYRLKGVLLIAQDETKDSELVEQCLERALELARIQNAKSFELRAVISIARMWHAQKKTQDALKLVTKTYKLFSEGFETRDLIEAKALLEELSNEVKTTA